MLATELLPQNTREAPSLPPPLRNERPSVYADRAGLWYGTQRSRSERKRNGVFFTPLPLAGFMGRELAALNPLARRLLEPAAGTGVLVCAAVEALIEHCAPDTTVNVLACEVDALLCAVLRSTLSLLSDWCLRTAKVRLRYCILHRDFTAEARLAGAADKRSPLRTQPRVFDAVIANPPFFKLKGDDPRARAVPQIVHGQPNIYALFMALSAAQLRPGGTYVFLFPRSFMTGQYLARARTFLFGPDGVQPCRISLVASRRKAFARDAVLQEILVLTAEKRTSSKAPGVEPRITLQTLDALTPPTATSSVTAQESTVCPQSLGGPVRLPVSPRDIAVPRAF